MPSCPSSFDQYNATAGVKHPLLRTTKPRPPDPAAASLLSEQCGATGLELFSLGAIEEGVELVRERMVAQLARCLGFDLADALAGNHSPRIRDRHPGFAGECRRCTRRSA